jgi:hypothetical protein
MFHEARRAMLGLGTFSLFLLGVLLIGSPAVPAAEPASAETRPDVTNSLDAIPAEPAAPAAPAVVLEGGEAGSILGKEVRSAIDEKLGRIVDVIVDRRGATRAAVIDFGGFLGVGSKKIAVAWDILTFAASSGGEDKITVQTTRDRLNKAPEFKDGKPITVLGARDQAASTQVTMKASEW